MGQEKVASSGSARLKLRMNPKSLVFTYSTTVGTFRIQPRKGKFGLFIDYPEGDFDLLTPCISPDDAIDYIVNQDTGFSKWDDLSPKAIPSNISDISNWQRRPFRSQGA